MRLNPKSFNAFLTGNIGQRVVWRPASRCPCVAGFDGQPTATCPRCAGKGWIWGVGQPSVVGVSRQNIDKALSQQVNWEMGDAMLTVDESSVVYEAGQFDRITMVNSTDKFSVALTRGHPTERLFMSVEKVDSVFWYTGPKGTGDLINGGVPAVNSDGTLYWGSGAPPAGKTYTISGTRFAEYFIYLQLPADRGEHRGARLPKRMMAKRFEVFGR